MKMLRPVGAALFVCWATVACGNDYSPTDATRPAQAAKSSASSLVMTVQAKLVGATDPELSQYEGHYFDRRQIESVALSIDGEEWGVFASANATDPVPGPLVAGWMLDEERSQAVVSAEVGRAEGDTEHPKTAGDWGVLLGSFIAPGGHVAEVDAVEFAESSGAVHRLHPSLVVPFEVVEGEESAFVGELEIEFTGKGEEP